jgi:ATP-dependent Clp protease ATP-binding subunit ClpA
MFRPEFRNRLDMIVTFKALPPEVVERVVDKFIAEIGSKLVAKKASLTISSEARSWIATQGYTPQYGARSIHRVIQKEIKDPLAEALLFGSLQNGGSTHVALKDDKLVLEFKPRSEDKQERNTKKLKKDVVEVS